MIRIETEGGKIGLGKPVFARIAAEQAVKFSDRILLTDPKGKPVKIGVSGRESLKYIEVSEIKSNNTINLKLHIMIKFGTSIENLSRELSNAIRQEALKMTGVKIPNIIIHITAVKSKRMAKRNLEVMC